MNRRRSIVQPSGGGPFFSDKKHRSPFASFKRGDSRDLQIPETPPEGSDRPGTALSTQEGHSGSLNIPGEFPEHEEDFNRSASGPVSQPAPAVANGETPHEIPNEASSTVPNEVSRTWKCPRRSSLIPCPATSRLGGLLGAARYHRRDYTGSKRSGWVCYLRHADQKFIAG